MSVDGIDELNEDNLPKYLCLQRALLDGDREGDYPSPTQMQAMYEKFAEWRQKFQDHLTDLGGRLGCGALGSR